MTMVYLKKILSPWCAMMHHWTPRVEALVSTWRDDALTKAHTYEQEASSLHRYQRCLTTPQVLLSGVVGSLGFAGVSSVLYGILGVLLAVLAALDSALQLGVRGHIKESDARQLRHVATQIDVQLVRERPMRDEAQSFVDKIVVQLQISSPSSSRSPSLVNPNSRNHSRLPGPVDPVVNCMMVDAFLLKKNSKEEMKIKRADSFQEIPL